MREALAPCGVCVAGRRVERGTQQPSPVNAPAAKLPQTNAPSHVHAKPAPESVIIMISF